MPHQSSSRAQPATSGSDPEASGRHAWVGYLQGRTRTPRETCHGRHLPIPRCRDPRPNAAATRTRQRRGSRRPSGRHRRGGCRMLTYADLPTGPAPIADRGCEFGLVGRRTELAAARALLRDHGAGLSLLVVSGEPGIGKSRLLAEVRRSGEDRGWRVATGQATKSERELPFAVFADALTPLVLAEPAVLDRLPAHLAEGLADILPAAGGAPDSLLGRRHRAYAAAGALLEQLGSGRGILLVLDDLHWADAETAELIDYLIHHPPAGPVVLVTAYRPYQIPGQLAGVLSQAVTAGAL